MNRAIIAVGFSQRVRFDLSPRRKVLRLYAAGFIACLAKASEFSSATIPSHKLRTAMNRAIIAVGFSQRIKNQQKCGFSQIKPYKHSRRKAGIKYIDNDNLICIPFPLL